MNEMFVNWDHVIWQSWTIFFEVKSQVYKKNSQSIHKLESEIMSIELQEKVMQVLFFVYKFQNWYSNQK